MQGEAVSLEGHFITPTPALLAGNTYNRVATSVLDLLCITWDSRFLSWWPSESEYIFHALFSFFLRFSGG